MMITGRFAKHLGYLSLVHDAHLFEDGVWDEHGNHCAWQAKVWKMGLFVHI